MNFSEEIEILIRARYALIYIQSFEELRVLKILADLGERQNKSVFEWSLNTGIVPVGTSIQSRKNQNSPTKDPLIALDAVIEQVDPALFIFKDFHPFLDKAHFGIVRKLKEIALHLKSSYKTIIIISPVLELPVELEKEICLLHFPLPGLEELAELLDGILHEVSAAPEVVIDLEPEGRERLLRAALGLTWGEAENVFAKVLVRNKRLSGDDVDEVLSEKRQIIRKNGLLEFFDAEEDFEMVGGMESLKCWLEKRTSAFSERAREFGLPIPRGILMLGVQGCGKSLCAKAVSNLWKMPLLRFDMGRMFGSLVGASEDNMRRAIAAAESVAPAILWIDEIDKAFAGTQGSGFTDGGTTARVFGTFLTWLSEKKSPVFVVATANDISQLPPELMRKGRLDEIFFVDLPTPAERKEIFRIHIRRRSRDPGNYDLEALVEASQDFSGAEIEEAINSGLYDAFSSGRELTSEDVLLSLNQTAPLSKTMDERISQTRKWAVGRARFAGIAPSE